MEGLNRRFQWKYQGPIGISKLEIPLEGANGGAKQKGGPLSLSFLIFRNSILDLIFRTLNQKIICLSVLTMIFRRLKRWTFEGWVRLLKERNAIAGREALKIRLENKVLLDVPDYVPFSIRTCGNQQQSKKKSMSHI